MNTEDIIAELRRWKSLCSFRVTEAGGGRATIKFDTLPAGMESFVKELYVFFPDLVDQGTGCVAEMVEMANGMGEAIPPAMKELIEGVDFEDENYGLEILKRELQRGTKVMLGGIKAVKKTVANSARGFLVFGEALAKAQVCKTGN